MLMWVELGAFVYAVMGLCLLALCRAASLADGDRDRHALERPALAAAR
jgi:hypothetical protein